MACADEIAIPTQLMTCHAELACNAPELHAPRLIPPVWVSTNGMDRVPAFVLLPRPTPVGAIRLAEAGRGWRWQPAMPLRLLKEVQKLQRIPGCEHEVGILVPRIGLHADPNLRLVASNPDARVAAG